MKTVTKTFLILYKKIMTPILVLLFGNGCRYQPTCSEYSVQAIESYGIFRGSVKSMRRILSCHPLSKRPMIDPLK